jgi:DNA-binding beta-propeller fold protein YncE
MNLSLSKIAFSLALLFINPVHAEDAEFRVQRQEILPGNVRWDYLNFDNTSKHLFLTRGDHVDVYDTNLNKVVGTVEDTQGVHGVALAPELNRGFTSNGRSNSVSVFDLTTFQVLATLPTEINPDAIIYDPFSKRVFAANGKSGSLTVIDAEKNTVIKHLAIGGKLETAAVNTKGLLYVNVEDKNSLAVVDTDKLSVIARHDLSANCDEPAGLSIDRDNERLFVGCHNQKLVVVSGATGKILASPAIGKGSDATAYDSELNLAFSSNSDGTLTIISADTYVVKQNLETKLRARTLALDNVSHKLYTVSADVDTSVSVAPGARPTLKADTFTLLEIGR